MEAISFQKYRLHTCSNPNSMRDANAKDGEPKMPRVFIQKMQMLMQKSN